MRSLAVAATLVAAFVVTGCALSGPVETGSPAAAGATPTRLAEPRSTWGPVGGPSPTILGSSSGQACRDFRDASPGMAALLNPNDANEVIETLQETFSAIAQQTDGRMKDAINDFAYLIPNYLADIAAGEVEDVNSRIMDMARLCFLVTGTRISDAYQYPN